MMPPVASYANRRAAFIGRPVAQALPNWRDCILPSMWLRGAHLRSPGAPMNVRHDSGSAIHRLLAEHRRGAQQHRRRS
jgi:hypothetical protein